MLVIAEQMAWAILQKFNAFDRELQGADCPVWPLEGRDAIAEFESLAKHFCGRQWSVQDVESIVLAEKEDDLCSALKGFFTEEEYEELLETLTLLYGGTDF